MSIAKTLELRRAFMGGVAAWIIQVLVVMAWVFLGGHRLPKDPVVSAGPAMLASPTVFASTSVPLRP